jgi:hypothetical protein
MNLRDMQHEVVSATYRIQGLTQSPAIVEECQEIRRLVYEMDSVLEAVARLREAFEKRP